MSGKQRTSPMLQNPLLHTVGIVSSRLSNGLGMASEASMPTTVMNPSYVHHLVVYR